MELMKSEALPVEKLYAKSEQLKFSIEKLKSAGMMKKAEAAQVVIDELHEIIKLQNTIINTLVYELFILKQAVQELKARAGL